LISTIVVDDEEPARELLRALLRQWPQIQIVGEAADGESAIQMMSALRPRLAFLDVQMPGLSGLDVADVLNNDEMPIVVFVTAFDRYAVKAFEISALDYLLKPFDAKRLAATMQRVFSRLRESPGSRNEAMRHMLRNAWAGSARLVVKSNGRHLFFDPAEVEWIEAVDKEVRLHIRGASAAQVMVRESLQNIDERLDPRVFVRVHRSAIVNRQHIREVQPWFKGDVVIILRSGARVITGRTYKAAVEKLLSTSMPP
jgi:two-component system LytT family response regulator